ncbi:alpha/beta fold hydrolase [Deminuibacter soli]|nr:alpha/beta hydrolase [Deminuibacter soli]
MNLTSANKLKMPVLAMGGDHSTGGFLGDHVRLVAENVTEIKISNAGHWIAEEQPAQVQQGLLQFFLAQ